MKTQEEIERLIEAKVNEAVKRMPAHEIPIKVGASVLARHLVCALLALGELVKPEPDGLGGFVADEFWSKEQLAGREVYNKILKELE